MNLNLSALKMELYTILAPGWWKQSSSSNNVDILLYQMIQGDTVLRKIYTCQYLGYRGPFFPTLESRNGKTKLSVQPQRGCSHRVSWNKVDVLLSWSAIAGDCYRCFLSPFVLCLQGVEREAIFSAVSTRYFAPFNLHSLPISIFSWVPFLSHWQIWALNRNRVITCKQVSSFDVFPYKECLINK